MILLIRHAEKSPAGEQYLTSQGLDDDLNYGKQLKQQGMQLDEIISILLLYNFFIEEARVTV